MVMRCMLAGQTERSGAQKGRDQLASRNGKTEARSREHRARAYRGGSISSTAAELVQWECSYEHTGQTEVPRRDSLWSREVNKVKKSQSSMSPRLPLQKSMLCILEKISLFKDGYFGFHAWTIFGVLIAKKC